MDIITNPLRTHLKAGLETGTKALAEAKMAAIQKAVFIVISDDCEDVGSSLLPKDNVIDP